ncbi:hypothetical protein SKAU_G00084670 [Synaphobranchus kaupii]|uniref:Uncharacterized protein n=1 Tax=Synaphobranchus kaupii TaxID=118154 RepID=A0A9Q1FV65_SYNKA|nr:hypothetical protein SKAU_G00084670 [Synaphobranchus kaupii]
MAKTQPWEAKSGEYRDSGGGPSSALQRKRRCGKTKSGGKKASFPCSHLLTIPQVSPKSKHFNPPPIYRCPGGARLRIEGPEQGDYPGHLSERAGLSRIRALPTRPCGAAGDSEAERGGLHPSLARHAEVLQFEREIKPGDTHNNATRLGLGPYQRDTSCSGWKPAEKEISSLQMNPPRHRPHPGIILQ